MTLSAAEKKEKRNAASRLRYWADRRLKDVIRRRGQLESWTETIVAVQEDKEAKAHKSRTHRPRPTVQSEVRAA